jgi:hypothetical protein
MAAKAVQVRQLVFSCGLRASPFVKTLADLTAEARISGDSDLSMQEMKFTLRKDGSRWLITGGPNRANPSKRGTVTEPATSRPLSGEWIPAFGHEPATSGAWNAYNRLVFSYLRRKLRAVAEKIKKILNLD